MALLNIRPDLTSAIDQIHVLAREKGKLSLINKNLGNFNQIVDLLAYFLRKHDFISEEGKREILLTANRIRKEVLALDNGLVKTAETEKQIMNNVISDLAVLYRLQSSVETEELKTINLETRNQQESLQKDSKQMREEIQELRNAKNELEATLKEQKERYQPLQTELELRKQAEDYSKTAVKYKFNARWWMVGIIISCLIFIWVLCYIKSNFCFDSTCFNIKELKGYNEICVECGQQLIWYEILKGILYRLIIVSASLYLISFCVKNYNASMHNKVINEAKENTASYAIHFYRTTTGTSKEDIMVKAAESIFAQRNTGYNNKDSEPTSPSFVQNIIDKVSPGK